MLPLYLAALGLGGVLIVASLVLGGHGEGGASDTPDVGGHLEGEVDQALDKDLDKDLAGAGMWLPLLSVRFWTFALAGFGLTGSLLSLLSVAATPAALAATGTGLGVGWTVATVFRRLQRDQVTGTVGLAGLGGTEARVLLPVAPGDLGKIRVVVGGQDLDLPARTQDERRIERGESALVVEVRDGVAVVTPMR